MSDIIQLLPDNVANQIAAGEVIQRPASVIKELMENAIDAGAKRIDVLVVEAGKTSIQVIDDGSGMSETDARLSFERHATSKIRNANDLFSLHTMGFRGEALASIAAVAQVHLKTRREDNEIGTYLTIEGSKFTGQEPCACPKGTNFTVENLFYNVPARRKFLKSNTTELNNILQAFQRIALVYPDIHFTFHSNGNEMYNLHSNTLKQRITGIVGQRINAQLLPIRIETSVCSLLGFVGKPEAAKKKGVPQYFFVNGRYMHHPYFHKAVIQAYDRLIPTGEQIPYFIYFDVNANEIDVNIHPTKTEIKFENEAAIWQIIHATVKDTLGKFTEVATLDFDTEGKPDIPNFNPQNDVTMPSTGQTTSYNPFQIPTTIPAGAAPSSINKINRNYDFRNKDNQSDDWEQLFQGLKQAEETPVPTLFEDSETATDSPIEGKTPTHYQYKGKYIITAVKSGLMIIDQHRAHVRVLYDKNITSLQQHKLHSQKILFPETVRLTEKEETVFHSIALQLEEAGFEFAALGAGTFAINAQPEGLENTSAEALLHDILADNTLSNGNLLDGLHHKLATLMAQRAAIAYGQTMDNQQMEALVNNLFVCRDYNFTPNGKRIVTILQDTQIDRLLD